MPVASDYRPREIAAGHGCRIDDLSTRFRDPGRKTFTLSATRIEGEVQLDLGRPLRLVFAENRSD